MLAYLPLSSRGHENLVCRICVIYYCIPSWMAGVQKMLEKLEKRWEGIKKKEGKKAGMNVNFLQDKINSFSNIIYLTLGWLDCSLISISYRDVANIFSFWTLVYSPIKWKIGRQYIVKDPSL